MAAGDLPTIYRRLGARVKQLREERGLTQQALAELIGVDTSYVVKIEGGNRRIQIETLEDIAGALQRAIREFFPDAPATPGRRSLAAVSRASEGSSPRGRTSFATDDELDDLFDKVRLLDRESIQAFTTIAGQIARRRS